MDLKDPAGNPLEGVAVRVGDVEGVTDAQGHWASAPLTPAKWHLTLRKKGYFPVDEDLEVPSPPPARLARSFSMKGLPVVRVRFAGKGRPARIFDVTLEREGLAGRKITLPGAGDAYTFSDLSSLLEMPGEPKFLLSLSNEHHVNVWRRPVRPDVDDTIPLEPAGQASVRVAKAEPALPTNARIPVLIRPLSNPMNHPACMDPQGRKVQVFPTAGAAVLGLAEGGYQASVAFPGYATPEPVDFWVTAGQNVQVALELGVNASSLRLADVSAWANQEEAVAERLRLMGSRASENDRRSLRRTIETWAASWSAKNQPRVLNVVSRLLKDLSS